MTTPPTRRPDGRIVAVCGATRSGKTLWTVRATAATRRLLVWDVKGEWASEPAVLRAESFQALRALLKTPAGDYDSAPCRVAFVPPHETREAFEVWAGAALAWATAAPCTVVAEELADVTQEGKARSAWGKLLRRGAGLGVTVYGLTQSPAESDKTTLRNAGTVHTGRLGFHRDRKYVAALMDCPEDRITALGPLDWLERDPHGVITAGTLALPRNARARARM